jgi:serine/threonine protein kinase
LHQDLHIGLSWKQKLNISLDVSKGMNYLHNAFEQPILHRDLKSLNLLLQTPVTSSTDYICTKITDFGLSRENSLVNEMMTANTGTYHWMAPEVLDAKPYTHKADVFSYGICLYEIITRTTPYPGMTAAQIANRVVNNEERPNMSNVPDDCPSTLRELMMKCWAQNPDVRPTFSEITKALKGIEL